MSYLHTSGSLNCIYCVQNKCEIKIAHMKVSFLLIYLLQTSLVWTDSTLAVDCFNHKKHIFCSFGFYFFKTK